MNLITTMTITMMIVVRYSVCILKAVMVDVAPAEKVLRLG